MQFHLKISGFGHVVVWLIAVFFCPSAVCCCCSGVGLSRSSNHSMVDPSGKLMMRAVVRAFRFVFLALLRVR
jgi:hypothetical protein